MTDRIDEEVVALVCDVHGEIPREEWNTQKTCPRCASEIGDTGRAPLLIRTFRKE